MKGLRACPVCPECGSKRFARVPDRTAVRVRCVTCGTTTELTSV